MEKGYCADIPFLKADAQEQKLLEYGLKRGDIYVEGRREESFDTLKMSLRGKPGTVHIFGTLRVFGKPREAMKGRVKELAAVGVVVHDLEKDQRSDRDGVDMLDAGLKKALGSRKVKESRKFARSIGAKGGNAKLKAFQADRMPEELAGPIWALDLPEAERLRLMNGDKFFTRKWTGRSAARRLGHCRKT